MSTEIKYEEKTKVSLKPPSKWKVIFLNDDSTPMVFVVELLTSLFNHTPSSASKITMEIHETGSGVAGVYNHEIAEQRGIDATLIAQQNNYPLQITIEEDV